MESKDRLSRTLQSGHFSPVLRTCGLDLGTMPPIAIITAHLKGDEATRLKETLRRYNAPLTTDASKARVFIGKVGTKRRAEFELRSRKLRVEEVAVSASERESSSATTLGASKKRKRNSGEISNPVSTNEGDLEIEEEILQRPETNGEVRLEKQSAILSVSQNADVDFASLLGNFKDPSGDDIIWVIKLDWIEACESEGQLVPLGDYLVYQARVLERPQPKHSISIKDVFTAAANAAAPISKTQVATRPHPMQDILDRAKSDAAVAAPKSKHQPQRFGNHASRHFQGKSFASSTQPAISPFAAQTANLLQTTTSEYEGVDSDTPQPPDWVKKGLQYACQRYTPANGPNEDFIDQLRKIRTARTLIDDDIGVRAYSTIIAAVAAYPHKLSHPRELTQLPGCDEKAAELFVEWKNTGKIQAVEEFENDAAMKILRSFYNIWGVGAKTARHFYYNNHWTDIDDIIEQGWNSLDRVQQIGIKYYDEFLVPIPRHEAEQIASTVRQHATRLRDKRITVTIAGGHRRGNQASADVDLIVSHPDLSATAGLIRELVDSLQHTSHITHTLTMSLASTHRGQQVLPLRSAHGVGAGFDTLDKALLVWQSPTSPPQSPDHTLTANPGASPSPNTSTNTSTKNPNPHRRVDIVISPWRTVGCALLAWSGGTTFQRDLRRYAKRVKGWRFDGSGVRRRGDGGVVGLEGMEEMEEMGEGVSRSPEEAEKRVFEGLGLEFIPPEGRVTD